MPDPFGSFSWICSHTPSPQCNLLFAQLWNSPDPPLTLLFPDNSTFFDLYNITQRTLPDDPPAIAVRADAGTGIGSNCQIPHVGHRGSIGDVALIVLSAVSLFFAIFLFFQASRRRAAVGRTELKVLLFAYGAHCVLQILTMTSVFEQGTEVLTILSSIHEAVIATFFWILLANAIVATQVVEDGTPAALVPLGIISVLFFGPVLYIALDTGHQWTTAFMVGDNLKHIVLFVLTLLWPAIALFLFLLVMLYVSLAMLREVKPALLYALATVLFLGGQAIFFLASEPLCEASNRKVNGAFLSAFLSSVALAIAYWAWECITETDWGDEGYQSAPGSWVAGANWGTNWGAGKGYS